MLGSRSLKTRGWQKRIPCAMTPCQNVNVNGSGNTDLKRQRIGAFLQTLQQDTFLMLVANELTLRTERIPPEPWRSFFNDLNDAICDPIELHCCGGFAITQLYGVPRTTA